MVIGVRLPARSWQPTVLPPARGNSRPALVRFADWITLAKPGHRTASRDGKARVARAGLASSRRARRAWPWALGWKSSGRDRQTGRVEAVVGTGHVDNARKPSGPGFLQERPLIGRIAGPADAGDQHPDDRHPPFLTVPGHGRINFAKDFPVPRSQRPLVIIRTSERLSP